MRKGIMALCAMAVGITVAGCANPSIVNVNHAAIEKAGARVVYVPRFEGSPEFVEESTDAFIAELQAKAPAADVIQGDAVRAEGADVLAGGNLAPTDQAIAQAKRHGAQLVVMGKVTSYERGSTGNGFSTVRVIDVSTGGVVATIHRPSGLLVGNVHQAVMAAVQRAADDVAKAIQ